MHILVFGATGGTGRSFLRQALDRGHALTAFVRDPGKLDFAHEHLSVRTGDVLDADSTAAAFSPDIDAVVVTIGLYHRKPMTMISEGTRNIVAAMQAADIKRIVVITSLGCGDSKGQGSLIPRLFQKLSLPEVIADKDRQEAVVREAGLDWTFIRPPRLLATDAICNDLVIWEGPTPEGSRLTWATSRATVAKLALDCLEQGIQVGVALNISDPK
jgi:uncharacterized protein YbjT (DUF2867 family)